MMFEAQRQVGSARLAEVQRTGHHRANADHPYRPDHGDDDDDDDRAEATPPAISDPRENASELNEFTAGSAADERLLSGHTVA
ncbi:hypothetical protein [Arenivirga flava]|uniref:hypothetical protein n=1 Tax=Arenivirga flava TaxID=1930060 RepID=UPI0024E141A0|nr:hypothetical protein [Arenivirga flava]